jgi:dynein heavy chain, axonemal
MLVALQFQFGGAIEGPFGTGKTETAKDLSRTFGRPCQVFNASEKFNMDEVTRLFKGVAGSGSWILIDEFNRMSPNMMNSITVIITQI